MLTYATKTHDILLNVLWRRREPYTKSFTPRYIGLIYIASHWTLLHQKR